MLISIVAAFALQAATDAPEVRRPPAPDPYLRCRCKETDADLTTFSGVVKDARLTLAPDGRSVNDRQETIFDIISAADPDLKGEVGVFHPVKPESCGVRFDYGKRYTVIVARDGDDLATDACIYPAGKIPR